MVCIMIKFIPPKYGTQRKGTQGLFQTLSIFNKKEGSPCTLKITCDEKVRGDFSLKEKCLETVTKFLSFVPLLHSHTSFKFLYNIWNNITKFQLHSM